MLKVEEVISSVEIVEPIAKCLKEPEELVDACFTQQVNLPKKLQMALAEMEGVNSSLFP